MIEEGGQYRLGALRFRNVPSATLREQFHLHEGDLFNVSEIRAGMEWVMQLYKDRGYPEAVPQPETKLDDATHRIDLTIRITEGTHKP
jgi:outer membrane protein assembly factor BamA